MIPRTVKRMFDERCEERVAADSQTAVLQHRGRKHVVRIVNMSGPFAAFPPDIRKDTDILHITRTWTFAKGDLLESK